MEQGQTLRRGARVLGATGLLILALISLGWMIRDFTEAAEVSHVWWLWAGLPYRSEDGGWWASSGVDPVLFVAYICAAAMTVRASSAAAILAATGTLTVAVRLPSIWIVDADWMVGVEDGLKTTATVSSVATLLIGLGLIAAAVWGREAADGGGYDYRPAGDSAAQPPGRPANGPAIAGFLFLGVSAAVIAAWEIYTWNEVGGEAYEHLFTGERSIHSLLAVPSAWMGWAAFALALAGAAAAVSRATFARPLGMLAGGVILGQGILVLSAYIKADWLERFSDLETDGQLNVVTQFFYIVAGLAVLIALAQPAQRTHLMPPPPGPPGSYGSYGSYGAPGPPPGPYGPPPGAPPSAPPPGW